MRGSPYAEFFGLLRPNDVARSVSRLPLGLAQLNGPSPFVGVSAYTKAHNIQECKCFAPSYTASTRCVPMAPLEPSRLTRGKPLALSERSESKGRLDASNRRAHSLHEATMGPHANGFFVYILRCAVPTTSARRPISLLASLPTMPGADRDSPPADAR